MNHAQVVSVPAVRLDTGEISRVGEWRDTIGVFAPDGVTVRMPIREFTGDVVVHCHLFHEDTGMMGLLETIDCSSSNSTGSTGDDDTSGSSSARRRVPAIAMFIIASVLAFTI